MTVPPITRYEATTLHEAAHVIVALHHGARFAHVTTCKDNSGEVGGIWYQPEAPTLRYAIDVAGLIAEHAVMDNWDHLDDTASVDLRHARARNLSTAEQRAVLHDTAILLQAKWPAVIAVATALAIPHLDTMRQKTLSYAEVVGLVSTRQDAAPDDYKVEIIEAIDWTPVIEGVRSVKGPTGAP